MNPVLKVFGGPTTYVHPRMENIQRGDVDFDPEEEEGEGSDWVPFSGWSDRARNPGQPLRTQVGPKFKPGETPEDVIHGEVVTPEEQSGADHIINGDHESDQPSDDPHVEHARQDLHTAPANDAVDTLSGLLNGGSPEDVGGLDEAHDYLSHHFTGLRVNTKRGVLMSASPAGMQLVKRKMNLPAIPERQPAEPTYTLTNKHGTFESQDPHRILRSMLAFQILSNDIAQEQARKQKEKDDQNQGMTATSGVGDFMRDLGGAAFDAAKATGRYLNPAKAPGAYQRPAKPRPLTDVPASAIFEPARGTDIHPVTGLEGGWVASHADAPAHWERDPTKTWAVSPGHDLMAKLNREQAMTPREDPEYPGHTFTYAPNPETGHIYERFGGGTPYFATRLHTAVREGLDLPARRKKKKDAPPGRLPTRAPVPPPHNPPRSIGPTTSAVQVNDLCPVCASGYLEPYDSQFHECLNCGSLVRHVGFEKQAALKDDPTMEFDTCPQCGSMEVFHRPQDEPEAPNMGCDRCGHDWYDDKQPVDSPDAASWFFDKFAARRKPGGLGRGLKDIQEYDQDPLNLASGGSENPDNVVDLDQTQTHHPLADEQLDPNYQPYISPKRILGAAEPEPITLDEHLGKFGFNPTHKAGDERRAYVAPLPGTEGGYASLIEGVPHPITGIRGWTLRAVHVGPKDQFTQGGEPYDKKTVPIDRYMVKGPQHTKQFNQPLTDLGDRMMPTHGSFLASGSHPVHDKEFASAIADVGINGRDSATYQNAVLNNAFEPPQQPAPPANTGEPFNPNEQRRLRGLSSVTNPGLARFESAS